MENKKLKDCIEIIIDYRGKTPGKLGGEWTSSGYRVISALNVHNGNIDNIEQIRYVSRELYNKWMKEEIKKNDCLLASEGASLGENTIWDSDEKIVLGQRLYAIRTNKEILDPWYFAAYMQTKKFRNQINSISTGSTVFGISQPTLLNLPIIIPEINIQRKIGKLYKDLKRKIIINNQINNNLEEMLKILYQRWFLEFEFPNEEGKPYKLSGGKMVWNEELKQEIPENWKVENLYKNSLSSVIKNGIDSFESKIYLETANINNDNISDGEKISYNSRPSRANMQPRLNSVWFAKMKKSIKHITLSSYATKFVDKYILSTGMYGLQCNEKTLPYIHSFINSDCFESTKDKLAHGATQQAVNDNDIKNIKLVIPTNKVLENYTNKTYSIIQKKNIIQEENQHLIELRNYLLPMLMNGQINVDDVKI